MSASRIVRKIAVLSGGRSPEREISLQSGRAVARALSDAGHTVLEFDPACDPLSGLLQAHPDVVLPMVHGTGGEDGTLQAALEELELCFVGSASGPSALTFDKILCQQTLRAAGIAVPKSVCIPDGRLLQEHHSELRALGAPLVVKPARQGSSVGISIVDRFSLLGTAIHTAAGFGGDVLVEEFVAGREITVPVIDGDAFPAVEIVPAQKWYDYRSKYMDPRTTYQVLSPGGSRPFAAVAVRACQITQVAGICRVDMRVTAEGGIRVLEINTIPGMTDHSLVPKSAASRGCSLAALCEQVIESAGARWRGRSAGRGAA